MSPGESDDFEEAVVRPEGKEADERPQQPVQLPPPFFPPGTDRRRRRLAVRTENEEGRSPFPEDAFIHPDAPLEREEEDGEEAVVTGMGGDDHVTHEPPTTSVQLREGEEDAGPEGEEGPGHALSRALEKIAGEIRESGEVETEVAEDAHPLERALRGLVAGFLATDGET